jgi:hypothetical protein|tara:strand:+ start:12758 stop:13102 length:345 start_codon:yes stop_codon:yes gene_type:complete
MDENLKIPNEYKIEILITEEELGISSTALLDGKMINMAEEHDILPIEEVFSEMVKQVNYEGKGLLPERARVSVTIIDAEGEIHRVSQLFGKPINEMYESGFKGITWMFDQITKN